MPLLIFAPAFKLAGTTAGTAMLTRPPVLAPPHPPLPARPQGNLLCTGCSFVENKAPLGGAVDLAKGTWAGFQQYAFSLNTGVKAGSECAACCCV